MKRIGILTSGGYTPVLNATLYGAVIRANELRIEIIGLIKGFSSLQNPQMPHIRLNPLFQPIPELDHTYGGTILGTSRHYIDASNQEVISEIVDRIKRLQIDGLVCVGGDGTLSGMQVFSNCFPTVLTPKTIDNDLGLNYLSEPSEWRRQEEVDGSFTYCLAGIERDIRLEDIINYVTPGYTTSVFVAAQGVQRIRTTAESHRRIAIVEVMGRQLGYIALETAYGQPDLNSCSRVSFESGKIA